MIRYALVFLLIFVSPLSAEMAVPRSQAEISMGFTPVVRETAPAVVNIYAKRVVETRGGGPFSNDPFFNQLFRDFGAPQRRVQNSLGSGVILSADGIVVTNFHVVGQATDIRVVLNDRREFSAEILLSDEESDLAILQMEGAESLPFLTTRDSDTVQVGELVLAIGNPFGVGQTVTSGIVSGLARSGTATGNARGYFIQTDAPINPGNSGGALVDVNGALIGVNTSILTRSGGSNGIGFAIPASLVEQFVAQARDGFEDFQRPWAGLDGQPVDADMAEGLGLPRPGGIVVAEIHPESAFAGAGLSVGDVITHVDGQEVNTPPEMIYRMSIAGIGAQAAVRYWHDGAEREMIVPMIAAPEGEAGPKVLTTSEATVLPGLVVSQITPALISRLGLPLTAEGVVVANPGPYGARVGLRAGDVLVALNGSEIETVEQVEEVLAGAGRGLRLDVLRAGRRIVMRVRI